MIKTFIIAFLAAALVVFASGVAAATGEMDRTGTIVGPSMMDHGTTTLALADGMMDRTGSIVHPSMMNHSGTTTFALADGMMDRTGSIVHPSMMNRSGTTTLASADGMMDRTGSIVHPSMVRHGSTSAVSHESQGFRKLLGADVADNSGDKLGIVDDLIAGADGRLSYVIVSRDKVQGVGKELVAVPVDDVPMSVSGGDKCILDISKAAFDKAPGFAISQRPLIAGRQWQSEARGYFSTLGKASSQSADPVKASGQQEDGGY